MTKIGPIAHGVLLIAALAFGYQTWQRDKEVEPKTGTIALWDEPVASFQSLQYDEENKSVRIEVRGEGDDEYLWGIVKTSRKAPPKPKKPAPKKPEQDDNKDDDATSSEDDSADGDDAEAEPEPELITTTREFPVGDAGAEFRVSISKMMALRDLGKLSEDKKQEYGLSEGVDNLTIFFKSGKQRTLIVGKRVFGGSDRYMVDPETGKGYVLSSLIMNKITGAEHSLGLKKLHDFEDEELGQVTVKTAAKERTMLKTEIDEAGKKKTQWADKDEPLKADLTLANFLDRVDKLKPSQYMPEQDPASMMKVATLNYKDKSGKDLGYLELYRKEPAEEEEGDFDAVNPKPKQKPQPEYFIKTARTRVLGKVSKLSAERVHQDLAEMFGAEPVPASPEPETPTPAPGPMPGNPHGGPPGPHGGPTNPHGGPTPMGPQPAGQPKTPPAGPNKGATTPPAKPGTGAASGAKPRAKTTPAMKMPAKSPAKPPAKPPANKPKTP